MNKCRRRLSFCLQSFFTSNCLLIENRRIDADFAFSVLQRSPEVIENWVSPHPDTQTRSFPDWIRCARALRKSPINTISKMASHETTNRAVSVKGTMSPYPTVVAVIALRYNM